MFEEIMKAKIVVLAITLGFYGSCLGQTNNFFSVGLGHFGIPNLNDQSNGSNNNITAMDFSLGKKIAIKNSKIIQSFSVSGFVNYNYIKSRLPKLSFFDGALTEQSIFTFGNLGAGARIEAQKKVSNKIEITGSLGVSLFSVFSFSFASRAAGVAMDSAASTYVEVGLKGFVPGSVINQGMIMPSYSLGIHYQLNDKVKLFLNWSQMLRLFPQASAEYTATAVNNFTKTAEFEYANIDYKIRINTVNFGFIYTFPPKVKMAP